MNNLTNEIKYKYAEDEDGNIVSIENAVSGKKYHCSGCKEGMSFRNGSIRQKHFSHINAENCGGGGGEGYLHETFKKMLLNRIKDCIAKKEPIQISWMCTICKQPHNGNLLYNIVDIKTEYAMEGCRPDLVLGDVNGKVPIIIEIVDKHEPEVNVLDFCRKYFVHLIRIKLNDLNDLEKLDEKIKNPTELMTFNQQQCPVVLNALAQQSMLHNQIIQSRRSGIRGSLIDYIDSQHNSSHSRTGNYGKSYGKAYRPKGSRKRK